MNPLLAKSLSSQKKIKQKNNKVKSVVVRKQQLFRPTIYTSSGSFTVDCSNRNTIRHIVGVYDMDYTKRALTYAAAVFSVDRKLQKQLQKKSKRDKQVIVPVYNFREHLELANERFRENPVIVTNVICKKTTNIPRLVRNMMYKLGCCAEINITYPFNKSMNDKARAFETFNDLSEKKSLYFKELESKKYKRHIALVYEYDNTGLKYGANIWKSPKDSSEVYDYIEAMGNAIHHFDNNPVIIKRIVLNRSSIIKEIRELIHKHGCQTKTKPDLPKKIKSIPSLKLTKENSKVLSLVNKFESSIRDMSSSLPKDVVVIEN